MDNENLQTTTLPEWLLGSGWSDAWLWQPLCIAAMLAFVLVVGFISVRKLCAGDDTVSRGVARLFGLLACLFTFFGFMPLFIITLRNGSTGEWLAFYDRMFVRLYVELDFLLGAGWGQGTLYEWLLVVWGMSTVVFAGTLLSITVKTGPVNAVEAAGRGILGLFRDLARISPRRILALAWLAWRESLRRKVWIIFAVFVVVILLAGWFMQSSSYHPAQLYLQFVLNYTIHETLLFAVILSSLSLPADIRDRTLHTIVTKPVRKLEILLGRLLGFTAMGTMLLAGIGALSYVFTVRSLSHTHLLSADAGVDPQHPRPENKTSVVHGHFHDVSIDPQGNATIEPTRDHTHELFVEKKNGKTSYRLGSAVGYFDTRVPVYARSLQFTDEKGKPGGGVNVGDEWMYRKFITGAATATWTFRIDPKDFPEEKFPMGIPIELTIEPFRTHKGNIERGVLGTLWVRGTDPRNSQKLTIANFQAKKKATDVQYIPFVKEVRDSVGGKKTIDFFKDIVTNKKGVYEFQVGLQCLERGQYFGAAQPDLYIRASDAPFYWNFIKGYFGIWLQMVMILGIGLFLSTFLGAAVALLGTISAFFFGLARVTFGALATGTAIGGGPFEAFYRMMQQDNLVSPLPQGITTSAAVQLDKFAQQLIRALSAVLPPYTDFDFARYVAFGFDIDHTLLSKCVVTELGYLIPILVLAYFALRSREIAL